MVDLFVPGSMLKDELAMASVGHDGDAPSTPEIVEAVARAVERAEREAVAALTDRISVMERKWAQPEVDRLLRLQGG